MLIVNIARKPRALPVISKILELLEDGKWHELKEIVEKSRLHEFRLEMIKSFLTEYKFIMLDEERQKVKLTPPTFKFFRKIKSIEGEKIR